MTLFSTEDLQRIERAVAAFEQKTSAEVVVVVVPESVENERFRQAVSWAIAIMSAWVMHRFMPSLSAGWILVVGTALALLLEQVTRLAPLRRLFIHRTVASAAVESKAYEWFAREGVYHTDDDVGILILYSELEHRVHILGDRAVHAAIGDGGWQRYAAMLASAVHEGRAREGLEEGLKELGNALQSYFPRKRDDHNELSDSVRYRM